MAAQQEEKHVVGHTAAREINDWFFNIYLKDWVAMGADQSEDKSGILEYWGVPLHAASVNMTKCLKSEAEVVELMCANQIPLQAENYTHTVILDRQVCGYNQNSGSIDVIWSRRRGDEKELERRAVHFDIHRTPLGWRVVAVASCLTDKTSLDAVWEII